MSEIIEATTQGSMDVDTLKLAKNSKGYNWEIKVVRKVGESDEQMLDRMRKNNEEMQNEYGKGELAISDLRD